MAVEWEDDLRRGIWPRSVMIWVIAVWTALLIIRPWETLMPWMADFRVERMYTLLAVLLLFMSGPVRVVASVQLTGVVLWFIALAVASACAFDPAASWDALYVYVTVFICFFVLMSAIRTVYQLLFIVTCYVVTMGLFLGKSQVEYHFNGAHSFSMGVSRLRGINETYAHPNAVAALAVISLPIWLFLWESRRDFTATWPRSWRKAFTWALGLYFPVAVSSIILTNSRTGIMAFGGFVFLVAASGRNLSRTLAGLAGGLVLLGVTWGLMPESNRHRLETLWAPTEGNLDDESAVASAEGRKVGVQLGMEMFQRFPVSGVGLNNFVYYRKLYLDGGNLVAHNSYGSVLGETGMLGAAAFVFLIFGVFFNARRTIRLAKVVPDHMVLLLAKLTVACRRSILLLLFVGMAGDFQGFAPLYWIAAYCSLAACFAQTEARHCEVGSVVDIPNRREFVNSDSFDYATTNAGADGTAP
jgi:O-antigen ligase